MKTKINLKDKLNLIPRNEQGDPAFTRLVVTGNEDPPEGTPPSVLMVFTPGEVVELVNRCLYQLEYQTTSHRNRAQKERELMKPVKEAFKRLFPGKSFLSATDDELEQALRASKEEKQ